MLKRHLAGVAVAAALASGSVWAQVSDGVVRIGVLNDQSGVYADVGGPGSVIAARMAVEEFGGRVLGAPVDVVSANHQNKADVGATIAREWFDTNKVDAITDLASSAVGLAAMSVAKSKNRIILNTASASTRIINEDCNDRTVLWTYDTYALSNGTARAMIQQGGDTWYFLTADYAFGHSLEKDTSALVQKSGGRVLGTARHPLNAQDFSSFVLQAQASKAKVVGLANAGGDSVNAIKAAREFGLTKNQKLASLLVFINDIHALGLESAQGLMLTEAFYWDLNEQTREWSRRFYERHKAMPSQIHAATYSAVRHYLKAVQAAGTDEAGAVMAKMRELPVNDMFASNGKLRVDGRMVHDMYLFQVKSPAESKRPWDYYTLKATIPGEQAFQPLSESKCPLVKH